MAEADLRKLIKRNTELIKKNNELLRRLHKAQRWNLFFRLFKWAVIIGAVYLGINALQPYLTAANDVMQELTTSLQGIGEVKDSILDLPLIP